MSPPSLGDDLGPQGADGGDLPVERVVGVPGVVIAQIGGGLLIGVGRWSDQLVVDHDDRLEVAEERGDRIGLGFAEDPGEVPLLNARQPLARENQDLVVEQRPADLVGLGPAKPGSHVDAFHPSTEVTGQWRDIDPGHHSSST